MSLSSGFLRSAAGSATCAAIASAFVLAVFGAVVSRCALSYAAAACAAAAAPSAAIATDLGGSSSSIMSDSERKGRGLGPATVKLIAVIGKTSTAIILSD